MNSDKNNIHQQMELTDPVGLPLFGLSIVIPVYNGSKTIGKVVQYVSQLNFDGGVEVILVDDGSIDNSAEICERLAMNTDNINMAVTFVKLGRNFGEHNAVMAGLNFVHGAYTITIDDDLQNPPTEALKLYNYARLSNKHVVYTFYEEKKHSWYRNVGSKFANWTASVVLDKPKDLYLSSFRCMSFHIVREIIKYKGPFPYIDGLIIQITNSIGSIKVDHAERGDGRSNYTIRRLLRLWISIALNFSTVPLRLISLLGFLASLLSLLFIVDVLWEYFYFGVSVSGWFSLMSAILFFSGTQLVMLGMVGEYIGRSYQTLNKKPQFVVEDLIRKPSK